jgi:hypothetical protein
MPRAFAESLADEARMRRDMVPPLGLLRGLLAPRMLLHQSLTGPLLRTHRALGGIAPHAAVRVALMPMSGSERGKPPGLFGSSPASHQHGARAPWPEAGR